MITGIDTVLCQTTDMDRAVAFYRDVLGLTPTYTSPHYSGFKIGSVNLGIHPPMEDSAKASSGNWILGLTVTDLEAIRSMLESAGVWVAEEFHDIPGGRLLDFRDPDGNWLQAIQRS